jgi:hypothetical protein
MLPAAASRRVSAFATALLFASGASPAAAEPIVNQPASGPVAAPAADDQATAALAFAAEHHPELVPLLERLRHDVPAEFAAAISDLNKTRERLAKQGSWQPDRQAAALDEWKLSSRIRLALAQLATNPSAEAEAELRDLVATRARNRVAFARADRERIATRLERLTEQIDDFERDPDAAIARELEALRAHVVRGGKRGKAGPAASTQKPKSDDRAAESGNGSP